MKKFFRRIVIPEYSKIQEELITHVGQRYLEKDTTHSWIANLIEVYKDCPTLRKFVVSRSKRPLKQIKFYCTPANQSLAAHVDGSGNLKLPFGLNLPLFGTTNTYHYWFNCPPENTTVRQNIDTSTYTRGYLSAVDVPIDPTIMEVIETLELDSPYVTKTDVMHGVTNPTNNVRLIAVLRWTLENIDYSEIEDVLDLEDIYVDSPE